MNKTKSKRIKKIRGKLKQGGRGRKIVVFRSNRHVLGQVVDLPTGKTLVTVFSKGLSSKKELTKTKVAFLTGEKLAQKALKLGVKKVSFDRSGYRYHGRIKALAEGARKGGLKF
ncbi:50S ribosomal protein L18 [Candidatus Shapirobacteria bacterium]|nr:50S ribosomal protein L18 [Candidatus Shapirobacteria bacterium]